MSKKGSKNLLKHIDNIRNVFGLNAIVAINKFDSDSKNEIELLKQILKENNIEMSLVECWGKGGEGAIDLANKVIEISKKNRILNLHIIWMNQ